MAEASDLDLDREVEWKDVGLVPIDRLTIDQERFQMRAAFREDVAKGEYARNFLSLKPVKYVRTPEGKRIVVDGFHTIVAWQERGRVQVPCLEAEGTEDFALLMAAGANPGHGIQRTPEDMRKAVRSLLEHPVFGTWASRKIADAAHVSDTFVGDVRAEYEREVEAEERKKAAGGNGKPKKKKKQKRVGRDGKLYSPKAKRKPKAGRALYDVKKVLAPHGKLVRMVDELYRAFGKTTERGAIAQDAAYEGLKSCLKGFLDGWKKRYQELARERPPEE